MARNTLDELMRSHDADVNMIPGVTCRVWLMKILQKLIQNGIVRCSNPDALQQECMSFGNQFAQRDQSSYMISLSKCIQSR